MAPEPIGKVTEHNVLFGVRTKLLLLIGFLVSFFLIVGAVSFLSISRIDQRSTIIAQHETPFVRSIEEALFAIIQSQFSAERALDIDDPALAEELQMQKAAFAAANERFKMFTAALTWGSESEAFRRSDGGRNHKAWISAGNIGELIVRESSPEQAANAGRVTIYYAGYINNVERAMAERERYLALKTGNPSTADTARIASKEYQVDARRFADLTAEHLREMIRLSNETTAENAAALTATKNSARVSLPLVAILGLVGSILFGFIFAERVVIRPIRLLAKSATALGAGKLTERVPIQSRDEIGLLAQAFNEMAARLALYTSGLEKEVEKRTDELNVKVVELSARERELREANARLLELDKLKSEFISVAAHQLRTPLSALKWVLGILLDENSTNLTAEQRSLLFKGFESNERMINLINEMLVVTRIESGKERFTFAPIHVEDVIDSTTFDFAAQAHVRHINLSFEKPKEKLPYINADPDKIRAVVQNLIENAIRYTPDGGSTTIKASLEGAFVKVSVTDTGIGIPKQQQQNIFNKFFRADNAVKRQTDGSGLGLYISKSIVEKHGGTIGFSSDEGKGTTFFFTLPMSTEAETKKAS